MKNKILKTVKSLFFLLLLSVMSYSCVSVKAYQKMYLNDTDMVLENRKIEKAESNFQVYREGASGASGGKTGGGCGCN